MYKKHGRTKQAHLKCDRLVVFQRHPPSAYTISSDARVPHPGSTPAPGSGILLTGTKGRSGHEVPPTCKGKVAQENSGKRAGCVRLNNNMDKSESPTESHTHEKKNVKTA